MEKNSKEIQHKLTTVKYNCDNNTHLIVKQEICKKCKEKTCIYICPADVYNIDEATGEIVVQYENCLECGACRIACESSSLGWEYPKGTKGVMFKQG